MDASDRQLLVKAAESLRSVLAHPDLQTRAKVPLLVFANKQDLPGALPFPEVAQEMGLDGIKDRSWHIAGCTATKGEGVEASGPLNDDEPVRGTLPIPSSLTAGGDALAARPGQAVAYMAIDIGCHLPSWPTCTAMIALLEFGSHVTGRSLPCCYMWCGFASHTAHRKTFTPDITCVYMVL